MYNFCYSNFIYMILFSFVFNERPRMVFTVSFAILGLLILMIICAFLLM